MKEPQVIQLIRHIVIIWDECEHVSAKRLKELSKIFLKSYVAAFPEGAKTVESPMILSTGSPILPCEIESFLHKGSFLPHKGINKDLALVKYCSSGLIDQNEKYHFLVDQLRKMRHEKGDPPMHSTDSVMVIFVTSDCANGMHKAIDFAHEPDNIRTNFVSIQVPKTAGAGFNRMQYVGNIVGLETKKRFIQHENQSLVLDLTR